METINNQKVTYSEQSKKYVVEKGLAVSQTYNFPPKNGCTRHLYVKSVSGTGSDAATVNIHSAGTVSVYAPTINSSVTVVIGCLYTKD